jgi:two-component system phosphate regulon response regulator PhoB
MARILLIDDSEEIGTLIKTGLASYEVDQALSFAQAETVLGTNEYHLFLIDVSLPDGNGFDLCLRLSQDQKHQSTPRILVTAIDETAEKVYGFSCGADDYLTKPFNVIELRARVDRFLKRQQAPTGVVAYDCFQFNLEFQKCLVNVEGRPPHDLGLTPTEFRLFLALARSGGHVMSRNKLEKEGWESNGTVIEARGIDTHIAHLRRKLGTELKGVIRSVYGQGYAYVFSQAA